MTGLSSSFLQEARAADRASAEALRDRLLAEGRGGHPALTMLAPLLAEDMTEAQAFQAAATAFEAGVKLHFSDLGGEALEQRGEIRLPDEILKMVVPPPWEPEEKKNWPHLLVDWRAAVAFVGRDLAAGEFAVADHVPGAHLLHALADAAPDRAAFVAQVVGPPSRDEALDMIAAGGSFLAQALPGYRDLDALLRTYRELHIDAAQNT